MSIEYSIRFTTCYVEGKKRLSDEQITSHDRYVSLLDGYYDFDFIHSCDLHQWGSDSQTFFHVKDSVQNIHSILPNQSS